MRRRLWKSLAALFLGALVLGIAAPAWAADVTLKSGVTQEAVQATFSGATLSGTTITLDSEKPTTVAGKVTVESGSYTIQLKGQKLDFAANALVVNAGASITFTSDTLTGDPKDDPIDVAFNAGTQIQLAAASGSTSGGVLIAGAGANVNPTGTVEIPANAKDATGNPAAISVASGGTFTASEITNGGTVTVNGNSKLASAVANSGTYTIDATGTATGSVTNTGKLTVGGTLNGSVTQSDGTSPSTTVNVGGKIASSGESTISASVGTVTINGGTISNSTTSKGSLALTGSATGTITSGTFEGNISLANQAKLTVTTGSFSDYLPSGTKFASEADDDFIVEIEGQHIYGSLATVQQAVSAATSAVTIERVTFGDWNIIAPPNIPLIPHPEVSGDRVSIVTFNGNGGSWAAGKTVQVAVCYQTTKLTAPTDPIYGGRALMGWYTQNADRTWTPQNLGVFTTRTDVVLYAQWAKVAVTIDPAESTVTPLANVSLALKTQLTPVIEGIAIPSGLQIGTPTVTTSTTGGVPNVTAKALNGAVTFTAPNAATDVNVAVSYAGGTSTSQSGYATAVVHVVDNGAIKTAVSPVSAGTITGPTLNPNGTYTLTAVGNPGYLFSGWTFEGTTAGVKPPASLDLTKNPIEVPGTLQGTWTATFTATEETVKVHRLWQPASGCHLLSADANEILTLTTKFGWKDEGTKLVQYQYATEGLVGVTRMYNPTNGDHLYTANETEAFVLEYYGWQNEGVKFAGPETSDFPVYRLWNSRQTANGGLGSHLWTADENEYDTLPTVPPVGAWKQEAISWYAIQANE